jgi:curved DNA-binding protein CbpA
LIDYYKILNVDFGATESEIKIAFRKLAVIYHPDKNNGDFKSEEIFKTILNAYEVLSDKEKKAKYDIEYEQNQQSFNSIDYGFDSKDTPRQRQQKSVNGKPYIIYVVVVLVIIILYLIGNSKQTTTGNNEVDLELENDNGDNRPQTGEIEF